VDLVGGRALRDGVADDVHVDEGLAGDGLVLGRLDVDDERGCPDARQHQGGEEADDLALHGVGPCHEVWERGEGRREGRAGGRERG
jgi:hypothetical protein